MNSRTYAPQSTVIPDTVGKVDYYADFPSRFVVPRNVEIWLPSDYEKSSSRRYAVLYTQDGQNILNPDTSNTGVDWGVDETLTRLVRENKARPTIVVAIWSTAARLPEYMPQKAVERLLSADEQGEIMHQFGPPQSDNYLRFLVEELKPFVDLTYRTLPDEESTLMMGSSMGALLSAYALTEYPDIFGGAGCLSTHWPAADGVFVRYLALHLPRPRDHRFYFDYGTVGLDADYAPYQQRVDEAMRAAGYIEGVNWMTKEFPGSDHGERWWRERVHLPLSFLLREGE